jgi:alkanesulfonate monooxygenase
MIVLKEKSVKVFTISPRTLDPALYWQNIQNVVRWSEQYDYTGVLIFTGNDTYAEPWLVAQSVIAQTRKLCPLVAVNPVYMHPFTAAKMISSLAYLYQRKVFLNMVTGTALSYLEGFNDRLEHDDRYERLGEYISIIQSLVAGQGLTSFDGKFYKVADLQLLPKIPSALCPEFLLAGQSEAARKLAAAVGAIGMQMLQPDLGEATGDAQGIHFGIITRPAAAESWQEARALFPQDQEGQHILDLSMRNTDSIWKKKMRLASRIEDLKSAGGESEETGYWLQPFRNFKADCPYFVGDYERVADLLVRLITKGASLFILDIPAREEEFRHINAAFRLAGSKLGSASAGSA